MPVPLHKRIGQLALVGFDGFAVTPELVSLSRQFDLGGIILFKRNVESPEQVADLAWRARALAREVPAWIGVDQEGGRVARLRSPLTEWPPMETLGRSGDEALAARFGRALAVELATLGITIDFAPVLDVLTNAANPVISGGRAISGDPEVVATQGRAIVRALQCVGVAACAKHFPGHGDTSVDSHFHLPLVEHPPDRFRAIDFVPFRAAIEEGVAGIMTGHLLVPAFDGERPATLSHAIVQGLLKDELGFDGPVFTDDMDMKAISARVAPGRAAVAAVAAGCDALLLCGTDCEAHAAVLEALVRAVEGEGLSPRRVEDALARQAGAKARFASMKPSVDDVSGEVVVPPMGAAWRPLAPGRIRGVIGRDEHQAIADEMRRFA